MQIKILNYSAIGADARPSKRRGGSRQLRIDHLLSENQELKEEIAELRKFLTEVAVQLLGLPEEGECKLGS